MASFPITADGFDRLQDELKQLRSVERPTVIKAIAAAREHGDLSENAEYHAAREKQSFIEGRIAELEDKMTRVEIIDVSKLSGDQIKFGANVLLADCDTDEEVRYRIVGEYEADISAGLISNSAPLARALIGKEVGDVAEVVTPGGHKDYEIVEVSYK
jgi:transcription elongation factor GreA